LLITYKTITVILVCWYNINSHAWICHYDWWAHAGSGSIFLRW